MQGFADFGMWQGVGMPFCSVLICMGVTVWRSPAVAQNGCKLYIFVYWATLSVLRLLRVCLCLAVCSIEGVKPAHFLTYINIMKIIKQLPF